MSSVADRLARTNQLIVIYKVQFEEVAQGLVALPAGCDAYGADHRDHVEQAIVEQEQVSRTIDRAVAERRGVGVSSAGHAASPSLRALAAELGNVETALAAPSLTMLRRIMAQTSPAVKLPPEGAEPCEVPARFPPLELVPHLGTLHDAQRLDRAKQRADELCAEVASIEARRGERAARLAEHLEEHGGWDALDAAAGQRLSQRVEKAQEGLQQARDRIDSLEQRAAERSTSLAAVRTLLDAQALYLLRARACFDALDAALDTEVARSAGSDAAPGSTDGPN